MTLLRTAFIALALLSLAACAYPRSGYYDGAPYSMEGTAGRGIH